MRTTCLILAMSVVAGLVLGGCSNTVDGVGRDLENAGQGIQRSF